MWLYHHCHHLRYPGLGLRGVPYCAGLSKYLATESQVNLPLQERRSGPFKCFPRLPAQPHFMSWDYNPRPVTLLPQFNTMNLLHWWNNVNTWRLAPAVGHRRFAGDICEGEAGQWTHRKGPGTGTATKFQGVIWIRVLPGTCDWEDESLSTPPEASRKRCKSLKGLWFRRILFPTWHSTSIPSLPPGTETRIWAGRSKWQAAFERQNY